MLFHQEASRTKAMMSTINLLGALLVLLVLPAQGHNWVNHPSRASKVSTVKPCLPKSSAQATHVQANPGQSIPVEWAAGHRGSVGAFILVESKDEHLLSQFSQKVLDAYLQQATQKNRVPFYAVRAKGGKGNANERCAMERGSAGAGVDGLCGAGCQEAVDLRGKKVFEAAEVTVRPPGWDGGRPSRFRDLGAVGLYQFNNEIPEKCRTVEYAAYENGEFPWIKALMKYQVLKHAPKEGDIAQFEVPAGLDAGKYVLHWWWRGYYDCTDVNVVPSNKQVTDKWGKSDGKPGCPMLSIAVLCTLLCCASRFTRGGIIVCRIDCIAARSACLV